MSFCASFSLENEGSEVRLRKANVAARGKKVAIVTMNSNLAKLCQIGGIRCWNINGIMFWLKLPLLPCEEIKIFI